ncbi:MAG: class I SAM-dependent methyltransferase [Actinomycetota bacterium]|nr:class I SAM-dependent methyltransferase [Actinomycetota bacterium]
MPYLQGRVLDFGSHEGVLTQYCSPDAYLGVERDALFIAKARELHPEFQFVTEAPAGEQFDTVAAFAVIEHIPDPGSILAGWANLLKPGGRVVATTPHPKFEWIHTVGAKVGLFSSHAHDEHEDLIDRKLMASLAAPAGLEIEKYKRFLFGANQLFVLRKR